MPTFCIPQIKKNDFLHRMCYNKSLLGGIYGISLSKYIARKGPTIWRFSWAISIYFKIYKISFKPLYGYTYKGHYETITKFSGHQYSNKRNIYTWKFFLPKRQEKILVVTNILFHNQENFLRSIFQDTNTTLESCYKLKTVLNELDRDDKDYLDSTMEGLVRYYMPAFDSIRMNMHLKMYDEFIIWRLMELLYTSKDMVNENYQKIKKNMH